MCTNGCIVFLAPEGLLLSWIFFFKNIQLGNNYSHAFIYIHTPNHHTKSPTGVRTVREVQETSPWRWEAYFQLLEKGGGASSQKKAGGCWETEAEIFFLLPHSSRWFQQSEKLLWEEQKDQGKIIAWLLSLQNFRSSVFFFVHRIVRSLRCPAIWWPQKKEVHSPGTGNHQLAAYGETSRTRAGRTLNVRDAICGSRMGVTWQRRKVWLCSQGTEGRGRTALWGGGRLWQRLMGWPYEGACMEGHDGPQDSFSCPHSRTGSRMTAAIFQDLSSSAWSSVRFSGFVWLFSTNILGRFHFL